MNNIGFKNKPITDLLTQLTWADIFYRFVTRINLILYNDETSTTHVCTRVYYWRCFGDHCLFGQRRLHRRMKYNFQASTRIRTVMFNVPITAVVGSSLLFFV